MTAVFVSVDSLVSRTLAAYLYTSNDPLNRLDPLGLWSWADTWATVAFIGATVGSLPETGWGYGLDLKGFQAACDEAAKEHQSEGSR